MQYQEEIGKNRTISAFNRSDFQGVGQFGKELLRTDQPLCADGEKYSLGSGCSSPVLALSLSFCTTIGWKWFIARDRGGAKHPPNEARQRKVAMWRMLRR